MYSINKGSSKRTFYFFKYSLCHQSIHVFILIIYYINAQNLLMPQIHALKILTEPNFEMHGTKIFQRRCLLLFFTCKSGQINFHYKEFGIVLKIIQQLSNCQIVANFRVLTMCNKLKQSTRTNLCIWGTRGAPILCYMHILIFFLKNILN